MMFSREWTYQQDEVRRYQLAHSVSASLCLRIFPVDVAGSASRTMISEGRQGNAHDSEMGRTQYCLSSAVIWQLCQLTIEDGAVLNYRELDSAVGLVSKVLLWNCQSQVIILLS
jgi:hypothetical protein